MLIVLLLLDVGASFGVLAAGYTSPASRVYGAARPVRSLETLKEWQQLEYGFASDRDRQKAQSEGNLLPGYGTPIDVQPHYLPNGRVRIFTTVPRFVTGIPYTLATVSERPGPNGPQLQPYPDYSWHNNNGDNCDQITSAFRMSVSSWNCWGHRIGNLTSSLFPLPLTDQRVQSDVGH